MYRWQAFPPKALKIERSVSIGYKETRSKIYRCDSDKAAMVAHDVKLKKMNIFLNVQIFQYLKIQMFRYLNVQIFKCLNI